MDVGIINITVCNINKGGLTRFLFMNLVYSSHSFCDTQCSSQNKSIKASKVIFRAFQRFPLIILLFERSSEKSDKT